MNIREKKLYVKRRGLQIPGVFLNRPCRVTKFLYYPFKQTTTVAQPPGERKKMGRFFCPSSRKVYGADERSKRSHQHLPKNYLSYDGFCCELKHFLQSVFSQEKILLDITF
jgi:hypothetical protein